MTDSKSAASLDEETPAQEPDSPLMAKIKQAIEACEASAALVARTPGEKP